MPRGVRHETTLRLELLMKQGRLDAAQAALKAGSSIPHALHLDTDEALRLVEGYPTTGEQPPRVEAIVRAVLRPPLPVDEDEVDWHLPHEFPQESAGRIAGLRPMLKGMGRFEIHDAGWAHVGTGWAVDTAQDGGLLIVTTRDVAARVARRTQSGSGVFLANLPGNRADAQITEFGPDSRALPLTGFDYLADDVEANLALAHIAKANGLDITPIPRARQDAETGEPVAIFGWMAPQTSPEDRTEMAPHFAPLAGSTCICPGFLTSSAPDTPFAHDCTTLPGQAGAPLISVSSKHAVGLHMQGAFGVGNAAVRISTLNRLLSEGAAGSIFKGASPTLRHHIPEHFADRGGYDPEFLMLAPVPLPSPALEVRLLRPADATDDRPFELLYQGFSVLSSANGPVLVAANIDGSRRWTVAADPAGAWQDDRLPDVGHSLGRPLIAARDLGWGQEEAAARVAVEDAAHQTLCLPDRPGLGPGDVVWPALIEAALTHERTHRARATVFAGPVVQDGDATEVFKVIVVMAQDAEDPATLHLKATAFLQTRGESVGHILKRHNRSELWEGFRHGALRTVQIRVADLEAVTGHDFGELRAFDPLAHVIRGRQADGALPPLVFPIEAVGQVVL